MGGKFEGVISIIVLAPLCSCSSYNRLPATDDEDKRVLLLLLLVVVVVVVTA